MPSRTEVSAKASSAVTIVLVGELCWAPTPAAEASKKAPRMSEDRMRS